MSHVAGRFAALAARYGIAVHFDAALRQRRRRRHELRSLVQQNAIHVKTIVALVLPFKDRHFMFDVRQIGGDCHVDRMARSVVLLSGRFHAAWIAVFHADAVMRAVDGHARLDLHAVDDGAEIRVAVPPMVDEAHADAGAGATERYLRVGERPGLMVGGGAVDAPHEPKVRIGDWNESRCLGGGVHGPSLERIDGVSRSAERGVSFANNL